MLSSNIIILPNGEQLEKRCSNCTGEHLGLSENQCSGCFEPMDWRNKFRPKSRFLR